MPSRRKFPKPVIREKDIPTVRSLPRSETNQNQTQTQTQTKTNNNDNQSNQIQFQSNDTHNPQNPFQNVTPDPKNRINVEQSLQEIANRTKSDEEHIPFKSIKTNPNPNKTFVNTQRTLLFSERNIKPKTRHLLNNLHSLLPHTKTTSKQDANRHDNLRFVNDLCMTMNCPNAIFFQEVGSETFLFMAKSPKGPTIKFRVLAVTTMNQLRLTGNCLKGSRAILHFDVGFDQSHKWKLCKEMLNQIFCTPLKHPKSKPFVDHVFSFFIEDEKIFFRNYQILMKQKKSGEKYELVEIGPRFVLDPIRIMDGAFQGEVIYNNDEFIPLKLKNKLMSEMYKQNYMHAADRKQHLIDISQVPVDEVDAVFNSDE